MNVEQLKELQQFLEKYNIKDGEYCIAGSFAMDVFGVKEAGDIDLCIHKSDRNRIKRQNGVDNIIEENDHEVHAVIENGGLLRFFDHVGLTEDDVIENPLYHFMYKGHKVLRPELDFAEKQYRLTKVALSRPKDFKSKAMLVKYFKSADYKNSYVVWDKKLVLYPGTNGEKIKMSIMHSLLRVLFAIKPIKNNWPHLKKFFWTTKYKSARLAISETHRVLFKKNSKN